MEYSESSLKTLPNLFIVGASKAGTTSLFHWLKSHPDFFFPTMKEVHYFSYHCIKNCSKGPGDKVVLSTICNNFDQYEKIFSAGKGSLIRVDNSPSYLFYAADTAKKIHDAVPDAKILIVLREPVEKIFSQYSHLARQGREVLDFETALSKENERKQNGWGDMWRYKESGYYADSVETFIDVFGRDKVKVCFFEQLRDAPSTFVSEVIEFSGANSEFSFNSGEVFNRSGTPKSLFVARYVLGGPVYSIAKKVFPAKLGGLIRRNLQKLNTGKKIVLADKVRQSLKQDYKDDINRLEEVLGLESSHLSKRHGW